MSKRRGQIAGNKTDFKTVDLKILALTLLIPVEILPLQLTTRDHIFHIHINI